MKAIYGVIAAILLSACGSTTDDRTAGRAPVGAGKRPAASAPVVRAGDDVRAAQEALQEQGLYRGQLDGVAGPETRAAVWEYQRRQGLPVTGMLDDETLQRLDADSSVRASGTAEAQPSPPPR